MPEAVRGWSLGGYWGVRFYTDSGGLEGGPQLQTALEKLKFKEIYQLKVQIYNLKIIESSNIFSSIYIMTMMIAY